MQLKAKPQLDELKETIKNKTAAHRPVEDEIEPKMSVKEKSTVVIRGVTFYKAEEQGYIEEEEDAAFIRKEKSS